jgi:hypothetical protein
MAKIKAVKVMTPGSVGRPRKKLKEKKGIKRLGNYRNKYTEETFLKALQAEQRMSLRDAEKEYRDPETMLIDRLAGRRGDKLGCSTVLSKEEEEFLVERIPVMGELGFPLGKRDLTHIVKDYLDRQGRTTK